MFFDLQTRKGVSFYGALFHFRKLLPRKLSDPTLAEEGHADVTKEFDPKPYPSIEGLRNMQRLLALQNPRLAEVNPANLIDTTFMRKLEESGFMAQLQARYRE